MSAQKICMFVFPFEKLAAVVLEQQLFFFKAFFLLPSRLQNLEIITQI